MIMADQNGDLSDPGEGSRSQDYRPPKELPFTSMGSFERDKEEYQRMRFDLHEQHCKTIRESPIGSFKSENAKEEMNKIGILDNYFGIDDILTEAITDPIAYVHRLRNLDIVGKLF
jgi:hypothetical protein